MMNMRVSYCFDYLVKKKEKLGRTTFVPTHWEGKPFVESLRTAGSLHVARQRVLSASFDGLLRVAREFRSRAVCGFESANEQQ
jgi:hypothetical protein